MNATADRAPRTWSTFWQRRVLAPVLAQLTQGVTPRKLAVAFAVGGAISLNPFLGTTTLGCLAAGLALRLNQPALQIANLLSTPLQLALIVPWVRAGEWLYGAAPMLINPVAIVADFTSAPGEFLRRFGLTGLHAATAWALVAPVLGLAIYAAAVRPIEAVAARVKARVNAPPRSHPQA